MSGSRDARLNFIQFDSSFDQQLKEKLKLKHLIEQWRRNLQTLLLNSIKVESPQTCRIVACIEGKTYVSYPIEKIHIW